MHEEQRTAFLQDFAELESFYEELGKFNCERQITAQKSTQSLKRNATSRTGCTEQAVYHEQKQPDQTFEVADNSEQHSLHPNTLQVWLGGKAKLEFPVDGDFADLVGLLEDAAGRILPNAVLEHLAAQIRTYAANKRRRPLEAPLQPTFQPVTPPRGKSRSNTKQNKQLAYIVTKDRRKLALYFSERTAAQDLELFCITHKIPAATKKKILRGLSKGQRLICLSV